MKPLNISLLIGFIAILHFFLIFIFRIELIETPVGVESFLISIKGIFTLACIFGLALGAMNFNNHKLLSVFSILLNILGAILK